MYSSILEIAHGILQIGGALLIIVLLCISLGVLSAVIKANRAVSRVGRVMESLESLIGFPMSALMSYAQTKTNSDHMSTGSCCGGCSNKKS